MKRQLKVEYHVEGLVTGYDVQKIIVKIEKIMNTIVKSFAGIK